MVICLCLLNDERWILNDVNNLYMNIWLLMLTCYYKMLIDAYLIFIKWNFIFKCEYYLTVMHTCLNVIESVLLSGSIHVFMHFLCWVYSHPLVAGWAPTPLWCRFAGRRSLVAVSLWGWLWSLLVYLSLLEVFIESML